MVIGTITEAVGIWFFSNKTKRYLYLLRNDPKNPEKWGLPGGKQEKDETLLETINRECIEEIGSFPEYIKLVPIEKFTTQNGKFIYHTFFCLVEDEFIPVLNNEHTGYCWIDNGIIPKPLHPGLWATLKIDEVYEKIDKIEKLYT